MNLLTQLLHHWETAPNDLDIFGLLFVVAMVASVVGLVVKGRL